MAMDFEGDEANEAKLASHHVELEEAVVYTLRGGMVRVVNAFTPSRTDIQALKRRYPDDR